LSGNSDASVTRATGWARLIGLTRSFIRVWAYGFGGFLLLGIVFITACSAALGVLFDKPIAGDFEIVQLGVAIAVFTFLPLCQLSGANVTVDSFTLWAGPTLRAGMSLLASLAAIVFAAVLLWRMSIGLHDYYVHAEYTAIIGIPLWSAFPPILFSVFLLLIASLMTAAETIGLLPKTGDVSVATIPE
jgi:TRAP-type C4-dicarboxylate transport system permease small subunit